MPAYRVTETTVAATMMAGLQDNLSRLQNIQQRLSSGREIAKPSDSPAGIADAMQLRSSIRRAEQFARNAEDGLGWLGTADQTMTSSLDLINRARDLVSSAVSGAMDSQGRSAIAQEIDSLKDSLIGLANTRYMDRPIFAGNAQVSAAYDSAGNALGDNGSVMRTVAEGVSVQVNLPGESVFGSPGAGQPRLFDLLTQISNDLRSNNITNLSSTDLTQLDASRKLVQDQLSTIGARYNRVDTMRTRAQDVQTSLKSNLSDVEDIDLPQTIINLQLQQTAYQSALAATAKTVQPSLVDFLK